MKQALKLPVVLELVFFLLIFLLAIVPLIDFDIWFHIKSGEIFSKMGIINYDVFSHSASGREWFPYEWLFQVIVYQTQQFFGFEAIKYLIALVILIQIFILYLILRQIFIVNKWVTFFACFFFFVSVFEFISARPHVFAYTFLITNLYLIFLYYFKNKNLLWLTIPITLLWANLHGSIFLDVAFFVAYTFISFIDFIIFKEKSWLSKAKVLAFFSTITAILTVLPPIGLTQYRLLWIFFQERNFISKFIDEWIPLNPNIDLFGFSFYTAVLILIILPFFWINFKNKSFKTALWSIPLLIFPFLTYTASRNLYLGYISLSLILGWNLSKLSFNRPVFKKVFILTLLSVTIFYNWILSQKRIPPRLFYPVAATQFIKDQHIKGNMFNDYGYGGYLLYHLYPDQRVFYDGRTDVYLCCEMKDTMNLSLNKGKPDEEYKKIVARLWDKYQISFVLVRTQKHSVLRKIAMFLSGDPNWVLVFWDDNTQMFVKKDGKNNDLIEKFGSTAATPYDRNPLRAEQEEKALEEYQRTIKIVDSAKSRNAIGFIYLKQGKFDEAKVEFEKAIQMDNSNESPFMNLAEMAASIRDFQTAIKLYKEALKLAPDRGLVYIRLGQLTLESSGNTSEVRDIWQTGIEKTVDNEAKQQLKDLLSKLSN